MLESAIEKGFKTLLESRGFKVLKLGTPGTIGAPDRMILRPRYWPGPPMVVEFKKPGAPPPRKVQAAIALDWASRGVHVLPYINSRERANEVVEWLIEQSREAYSRAKPDEIYDRALPKE